MSGQPTPGGEATTARIPFNRAARAGTEQKNIDTAIEGGHLAADGPFTAVCSAMLGEQLGSAALLVHSCTAALEIAAILANVSPGDEVIMPSYTFVSTANAFVGRGATPVFVDVLEDTLNIDPDGIAAAITTRTKAIVPVHYAGMSCEIDRISDLAEEHDLFLVEDAAQGLLSTSKGRPLGTMGQLGAISFHETKNVTCGEGGVLVVNDRDLLERAEIIREKGTDRSRFFRGQTDKYTWVDIGSSYALSDLGAAFLKAQLDAAERLTQRRLAIWNRYHAAFADLEREGALRRPSIPADCTHNAHMYYLLLADERQRDKLIAHLGEHGIGAVFHYVPLHSSPAGRRYGRTAGSLAVTESASARLVRLPLWAEMGETEVERVIASARDFLARNGV
ncbi:MAG TPA: dTDP-4-amino-4,6-dideoxygalactose transaminase [Solirubrobacterales bacterium]|jgi:dTDP-4-amino-4,6-dideoxygalactose transaminase|nr:dTDP-4-amino-4,6-dideoxygalactose transaminase [Solirubrobacterales bacterium]